MKALTPVDAYALINELSDQALGKKTITAVDTRTFVAAGEAILASGKDNVINSISILITKVVNSGRAYTGKLQSVMASDSQYGNRILKRKTYSKEAIQAGNVNTDLNPDNIGDGLNAETDGVGSQWEMSFAPVLEYSFGGSDVWSYEMPTVSEDALKDAFRNEVEFVEFMNIRLTAAYNKIEANKEAFARLTVLNRIAGIYKLNAAGKIGNESVVDLIAYANKKFGTTYTRTEMLTEHREEFLKAVAVKLNTDSARLTNLTTKYCYNPTKTVGSTNYVLEQHTPLANQKMLYYAPLVREMETVVLPNVFHKDILSDVVGKNTSKAEGVEFWQTFDEGDDFAGAAIKVNPALPEGESTTAVEIPFVFGMLYDEEGLMVNYQLDNVRSTNVHARKGVINTFANFKRLPINDFTDQAIIYVLGEGGEQ